MVFRLGHAGLLHVPSTQAFLARKAVLAFVSPRGTSPWHTIVAPTRYGVTRFTDLTELETIELWVTAKQVMQKVEERLKVRSFQVVILEGPSEPAVMMHLIPRMQGESKPKMDDMPLKDV